MSNEQTVVEGLELSEESIRNMDFDALDKIEEQLGSVEEQPDGVPGEPGSPEAGNEQVSQPDDATQNPEDDEVQKLKNQLRKDKEYGEQRNQEIAKLTEELTRVREYNAHMGNQIGHLRKAVQATAGDQEQFSRLAAEDPDKAVQIKMQLKEIEQLEAQLAQREQLQRVSEANRTNTLAVMPDFMGKIDAMAEILKERIPNATDSQIQAFKANPFVYDMGALAGFYHAAKLSDENKKLSAKLKAKQDKIIQRIRDVKNNTQSQSSIMGKSADGAQGTSVITVDRARAMTQKEIRNLDDADIDKVFDQSFQ